MENKHIKTKESEQFNVQICFSLKTEQNPIILNVSVLLGSCIRDALISAVNDKKLKEIFPGFTLETGIYGIFGKKKSLNELLKKGDRIEIYRPLIANPMEARRGRVNKATKVNVKN